MKAAHGEDRNRLILSGCSACPRPGAEGGLSLSLRSQRTLKKRVRALRGRAERQTEGVLCPWRAAVQTQDGNKTQADHVGPVNVISKVLITSWRLCESCVCWKSAAVAVLSAAAQSPPAPPLPHSPPKTAQPESLRRPGKRDLLPVDDSRLKGLF